MRFLCMKLPVSSLLEMGSFLWELGELDDRRIEEWERRAIA